MGGSSIDKLVGSFIAPLTKVRFEHRGVWYEPKALVVSPLIFRGFSCPSHCGACCSKGTLEWLPDEFCPKEADATETEIEFNGQKFTVFQNTQDRYKSPDNKCQYLNRENGYCKLHRLAGGNHPFLCDSVPLTSTMMSNPDKANRLLSRPLGRKWRLTKITGEKGGECEMLPATKAALQVTLARLHRLKAWLDHLNCETWIDEVINYVETGPHDFEILLELI